MQAIQRSKIAMNPRMMQAAAIAPAEEGCRLLKSKLSPPSKCSQGTIIMPMSMGMVVSLEGAAEGVAIDIGIDIDTGSP